MRFQFDPCSLELRQLKKQTNQATTSPPHQNPTKSSSPSCSVAPGPAGPDGTRPAPPLPSTPKPHLPLPPPARRVQVHTHPLQTYTHREITASFGQSNFHWPADKSAHLRERLLLLFLAVNEFCSWQWFKAGHIPYRS